MVFASKHPLGPLGSSGVLGIILLAVSSGYFTYGGWQKEVDDDDPFPLSGYIAVLRENNRGIGYMERFNYAKALETFEHVNQTEPNWLREKSTWALALLNIDDEQNRTEPSSSSRESSTRPDNLTPISVWDLAELSWPRRRSGRSLRSSYARRSQRRS